MKSLKSRVQSGELVLTETDKSKRFCLLTKSQYESLGAKHIMKDEEITPIQLSKLQRVVNMHSEWLAMIFNVGENWNQNDRVSSSMQDWSESVAPLYLLIKDHKGWSEETGTPPPSRPVCSGNRGFNKHLSELVSLILEPLSHAMEGGDVNSTGAFLDQVKSSMREKWMGY